MTKTEKILACHGNLIARSTAKVCTCSLGYVYFIWKSYDKPIVVKNSHRSAPKWCNYNKKY